MELVAIAGMESVQHEFDNAYNLAAGFESIIAAGPSGSVDGFESTFAMTVFNLNDISFAGQEGFLDSVKKGARKVYEWIKDLIKTIRGWFTGSSKAEYEKAKKEITDDLILIKQVEKLRDRGIDAYISHDRDEGVTRIIKRMPSGAKEELNQAIVKAEIENVSTPAELKEKITGTVVNEIAAKVSGMVNSINIRAAEIKRIDPTGEALEMLGLDAEWNHITDSTRNVATYFDKEDQTPFGKRVLGLTRSSDEAQAELAKVVVNLDKLNEKYKGHEHTDEGRKLSRCVSVVRLLTEIAAIYRDTIITINSKAQQAAKTVQDGIVKDALRAAIQNTDEATAVYLKQLMDAM